MIEFGKYDRKCKFKTLGNASDGAGGFLPTETVVLETFCRAVQMRGGNNIEVAQLGLPKTYQIGIQYRSGFNPDVNVILEYDGFDHTIKGVELNAERQRKEWILTLIRGNEH
jgi:SPP1 family predicted phage head-tail adaptor